MQNKNRSSTYLLSSPLQKTNSKQRTTVGFDRRLTSWVVKYVTSLFITSPTPHLKTPNPPPNDICDAGELPLFQNRYLDASNLPSLLDSSPPPPVLTPRLNLHGFLPRLELIVTKILSHLLILPAPPSPMAFPSYVSYVLVKTNLKMGVA